MRRAIPRVIRPATNVCAVAVLALSLLGCGAGRGATQTEAVPVRATVPAETPVSTLRWQARNESGIYGYLVFRADHQDGPFLRISESIIHVDKSGEGPGSYTFVDRDVEPGRTYYYSLDVVKDSGQKMRFSGVMSKKVPL